MPSFFIPYLLVANSQVPGRNQHILILSCFYSGVLIDRSINVRFKGQQVTHG